MNHSRMKKAGYTACIAAVLYGLPHYWWGLGIGFAFPGDFQEAPDEFWTHVIGYWGMGTLALLAAVFALAFARPWGLRLPKWLLIIPAAIGSVLLSLWGFTYFVMQYLLAVGRVQLAPMYATQDASPMAVWGYFWYALFLIWGISLGAAAYYAEKVRKQNKANHFTK
ncbi:DUF3995 domain-containing protein [Paenibacillus sp. NPDC058910]|uniref:DUF3995 domain-containing protein n=1 Tax=unclassified Paenibacillus TaxID=185978 RepID=UPI0036B73271